MPAVPPHETAKAAEDVAWDESKARDQLRRWASKDGSGEKDTIDWNKYRQGFAWYDPEHADDFSGYKLPHHYVQDGKLVVVLRGVIAAAVYLDRTEIPEKDKDGVRRHLARHYHQFGRKAPWEEEKGRVVRVYGEGGQLLAEVRCGPESAESDDVVVIHDPTLSQKSEAELRALFKMIEWYYRSWCPCEGGQPKLYSFKWIGPIPEEWAKALRLVKFVAIYAGESAHPGDAHSPKARLTDEEILRSARTLKGALIDIDHALVNILTQLNAGKYAEKWGLNILGPVGQVLDAEAEYNEEVGGIAVEGIATIWDQRVYDLIKEGRFKGCSVVQFYRSERCSVEDHHVCDYEGSWYPMVSLVLEHEPAFPKTFVKPLELEKYEAKEAAESIAESFIVPVPGTGLIVQYSLEDGGFKRSVYRLKDEVPSIDVPLIHAKDDTLLRAVVDMLDDVKKRLRELVDLVSSMQRVIESKIERYAVELGEIRERLAALESRATTPSFKLAAIPRAKPSGLIEAKPVKGNGPCNHREFLASLPEKPPDTENGYVPAKDYLEIFRAAESETAGCGHGRLLDAWRLPDGVFMVSQTRYMAFLSFLREVLSKAP